MTRELQNELERLRKQADENGYMVLARDRELERLREELAKHGRGKCMEYNAKYGGDVRIPLEEEA